MTDAASVRAAFDRVVEAFGGVDIVVSNAGAAWQGRIGEVDEAVLSKSFELNFYGHQRVAQAAVRIMLAQGTGGCLLFNVSKQAVNPGPNFGPYGLPKAATLFLVRQYALDYGAEGIRANAVNADRIRSGLLHRRFHQGALARRAALSEKDYMSGNLLRPRGHGGGRGPGVPAPGAGVEDDRRRDDRRRRQYRCGATLDFSADVRIEQPDRATCRRRHAEDGRVPQIDPNQYGLPLVARDVIEIVSWRRIANQFAGETAVCRCSCPDRSCR